MELDKGYQDRLEEHCPEKHDYELAHSDGVHDGERRDDGVRDDDGHRDDGVDRGDYGEGCDDDVDRCPW